MKCSTFTGRLIAVSAVTLSLAPLAVAQTTGTVNFTAKQQQIDGFGVAATFGRSGFIQTATGTVPQQVVDLFFNPKTGAGMSMLRFGIDDVVSSNPLSQSSASGVANSGIFIVKNTPSSCSVNPTYTWDHSAGGEVWLGQQAVKYGINRFYADSWGAPAYMKTNNNYSSGGVVCDGTASTQGSGSHCLVSGFSDCRAAYSNYMVQYIKDYQSDGVPISDMGWINEPNENQPAYASMTPTSAQAINFLNVYGPIVRAALPHVNQVCCDVFNWSTANTFNTAVVNNATANSYVDIYSAHEYGQAATFVQTTGTPKKKNWMSEWAPASPVAWNPYWDSSFAGTSNNYSDGMLIANDISNALNKGQISGYLYWFFTSTSTTGAMVEMGGPYVAGQTYQSWPYFTYTVPARLYALGHFSRFVRPGAYQVTMSTNSPACTTITQGVGNCVVTTAFVNPDGSKVINIVNNITTGTQALNLTLDAGTANWVPSAYVTSAATIPNASANSASPVAFNTAVALTNGVATVNGTTLTASLPARSFTTIVLAAPVVEGTVDLITKATLLPQGDGGYLATVTVSNSGTGTAQNVTLTGATLGAAAGTTLPIAAMPYSVGNIAPGGSSVVSVNFPAGQAPGAAVVEKYTGAYTGGTFNGAMRATLPALPTN